jgi:hypothetical protein
LVIIVSPNVINRCLGRFCRPALADRLKSALGVMGGQVPVQPSGLRRSDPATTMIAECQVRGMGDRGQAFSPDAVIAFSRSWVSGLKGVHEGRDRSSTQDKGLA